MKNVHYWKTHTQKDIGTVLFNNRTGWYTVIKSQIQSDNKLAYTRVIFNRIETKLYRGTCTSIRVDNSRITIVNDSQTHCIVAILIRYIIHNIYYCLEVVMKNK